MAKLHSNQRVTRRTLEFHQTHGHYSCWRGCDLCRPRKVSKISCSNLGLVVGNSKNTNTDDGRIDALITLRRNGNE